MGSRSVECCMKSCFNSSKLLEYTDVASVCRCFECSPSKYSFCATLHIYVQWSVAVQKRVPVILTSSYSSLQTKKYTPQYAVEQSSKTNCSKHSMIKVTNTRFGVVYNFIIGKSSNYRSEKVWSGQFLSFSTPNRAISLEQVLRDTCGRSPLMAQSSGFWM